MEFRGEIPNAEVPKSMGMLDALLTCARDIRRVNCKVSGIQQDVQVDLPIWYRGYYGR